MSTTESSNEEKVADFVIEDEAFRDLKLREAVFHPNRSWKTYCKPAGLLLLGLVLVGIGFNDFATKELLSPSMPIGFIIMLNGVHLWHKIDADIIHKRIDGLIELQSKEKF